jgi:hypothetical protein
MDDGGGLLTVSLAFVLFLFYINVVPAGALAVMVFLLAVYMPVVVAFYNVHGCFSMC